MVVMPEPVPMDAFQCEGCKGEKGGYERAEPNAPTFVKWADCRRCHGIGVVFRVRDVKPEKAASDFGKLDAKHGVQLAGVCKHEEHTYYGRVCLRCGAHEPS